MSNTRTSSESDSASKKSDNTSLIRGHSAATSESNAAAITAQPVDASELASQASSIANQSNLSSNQNDHPPGVFPEFDELADQIGEFIHYWGFKRIHGRIWTHLYLAERPVDAGELVTQLQISKALVSISLRELMEFNVILEVGKSPRGTNLYTTNADLISVITSVLRQREKRLISRIAAAHESLSRTERKHREEAGLSDQKLAQLKLLIEKGTEGLESIISLKSFDFGSLAQAFQKI